MLHCFYYFFFFNFYQIYLKVSFGLLCEERFLLQLIADKILKKKKKKKLKIKKIYKTFVIIMKDDLMWSVRVFLFFFTSNA